MPLNGFDFFEAGKTLHFLNQRKYIYHTGLQLAALLKWSRWQR